MKNISPGLSETESKKFSRLLPYWGLDEHAKWPTGGLENKPACLSGLSETEFAELETLLNHTGIVLQDAPKPGLPQFFVEIGKNTSTPLAVQTKSMTYYLKPLRKETTDVQTWVHKHLWIPTDDKQLSLTFHTDEEINMPEWLCYLIIQYFMQPVFQPLSDLSFSEYEHAVQTILKPLNSTLASRQLSLGRHSQENWPQLPPEQDMGQTMNPFKPKNDPSEADPIDPFRKLQKPTERKAFNPFRKK